MRRYAMRLALRLAGWWADKLLDLAEALDAMDNPSTASQARAVEELRVPIVPRMIPHSERTLHGYACSMCGRVIPTGACDCGLSEDSFARWSNRSHGVC